MRIIPLTASESFSSAPSETDPEAPHILGGGFPIRELESSPKGKESLSRACAWICVSSLAIITGIGLFVWGDHNNNRSMQNWGFVVALGGLGGLIVGLGKIPITPSANSQLTEEGSR